MEPTATQHPGDIEFVFYHPGQPCEKPSEKPIPDTRATWEKLVDRIGDMRPSQRLQVQSVLKLLPRDSNELPISTASRLASNVSSDRNERRLQELLIATLCFVLYRSGRAAPEELDPILNRFSKSSDKKYLDTLKRAGKIANEVIVDWAETGDGDLLQRLDYATQAVLQGELSS